MQRASADDTHRLSHLFALVFGKIFNCRWIHPASGRVYSYSYKPPKQEGIDDECVSAFFCLHFNNQHDFIFPQQCNQRKFGLAIFVAFTIVPKTPDNYLDNSNFPLEQSSTIQYITTYNLQRWYALIE